MATPAPAHWYNLPNGLEMYPHQRQVHDQMWALTHARASHGAAGWPDKTRRGLIAVHQMGAGKTMTAAALARNMLADGHVRAVYITAPKSVQGQWERTLADVGLAMDVRVHLGNHHAGLQDFIREERVMPYLFIVDEAHNLRTKLKTGRSRAAPKNTLPKKAQPKAGKMLDMCQHAEYVLMLTGTPVVNHLGELYNLAVGVHGMDPLSYSTRAHFSLLRTTDRLPLNRMKAQARTYRGMFSVFRLPADHPSLPRVEEKVVHLTMDAADLTYYDMVDQNLAALPGTKGNHAPFMNGARRAVNIGAAEGATEEDMRLAKIPPQDGQKLQYLKGQLQPMLTPPLDPATGQTYPAKLILYSMWKGYGIELVQRALDELECAYHTITGDTDEDDRRAYVDSYNSNDVQALLFTSAAAEGIDLKGTTHVIIMEQYWNRARIDQAVGRAVRIGSHAHLPPALRVVHVTQMVLRKPAPDADGKTADERQAELSDEKTEWITRDFEEFMQMCVCAPAAPPPLTMPARRPTAPAHKSLLERNPHLGPPPAPKRAAPPPNVEPLDKKARLILHVRRLRAEGKM